MNLYLKILVGAVGFVAIVAVIGGLYIAYYRPVSLKLRGINAVGLTIQNDGVYIDGEPVPGADPKSFMLMGERYGYAKDANHVYFLRQPMPGVSPAEFTKINDAPDDFGFRDKTRVFLGGQAVNGADPDTFHAIGGGLFRDKNNVFWRDQLLPELDVATFQYVGLGYGKDRMKVYQFGSQGGASDGRLKAVEGADPATFEVIPGAQGLASVPSDESLRTPDSKDKNHTYRNGKALP